MSVRLAERAIDALDTLLKAELGTELGLIDTDRADGLAMVIPAQTDYYHYSKPVVIGNPTVEIFEEDFTFLNPFTDVAAQRAVYELTVNIRVTWFNRDDDDLGEVSTRGRRYLCGLFNVLNKNDTLDDSDDATQVVTATAASGSVDSLDNHLKGQATLTCTVRCEETQA